jgi:hypothetical protein
MERKAVAQKTSAGVRIPYLPTSLLSEFPEYPLEPAAHFVQVEKYRDDAEIETYQVDAQEKNEIGSDTCQPASEKQAEACCPACAREEGSC